MAGWSFLTNHARVLLCIAHDPGVRLRDIAARVGIAERTAYGIVTELAEAGYVAKDKDGRRNRYQIQAHLPLPAHRPGTHHRRSPGTPRRRRRNQAAHPGTRDWPSPRPTAARQESAMADAPLMAGKSVLVTGGTGGIGQATAIGLAALGARVGIGGRDLARAEAAAARLWHASGLAGLTSTA